jgi:hypothetical protein
MISGWFMALGLSERAARILAPIALALVALGALYLILDAYGDARYDAGKDEADRQWRVASERLGRQSQDAAAAADRPAAERESAYADKLAAEKEKVDAAIADGGDPLDILF